MTQITTTLRKINGRDNDAPTGYYELWAGLGNGWGKDDPIPFAKILEISGLDFALRCSVVEKQHEDLWCLMAVRLVREVQRLIRDKRSSNALNVVEGHAKGEVSRKQLEDAQTEAAEAEAAARGGEEYPTTWRALAALAVLEATRVGLWMPYASGVHCPSRLALTAAAAAAAEMAAAGEPEEVIKRQKQIFLEIVGG